ncbi:MAG: 2-amino-4-hydroxy-6-hydroxymethyldihydropteridine diphosphokinase [Actinobacteria bacterium]|nr:2-amino-4-hydroxy-6-hydroxymethyldihydropteridine diphosphokinase [Actinomycetota bacterium]MCG2820142.1 2-amino-4-hydroxy-6-hydroxymethyldihydropteridine diphosphokinase [Actinomycetes bacterium]MBU4219209.1 2-amino-4-hydroxy-6-hydroxymethyldihydropteridine diphosphokinase [Actinomycetota bacterium]MBU4359052.1 2-amino-4-hydroxy-6-hydroxymethyldihydropteridine diphosphokinase [Actinomycetota bacterium]MBU4392937.1 2-amino-4-hydroxy-6-hydroxymethyldihydropteridine diphosphokinase [Actinomyce
MSTVYLGVGSNQGDRLVFLRAAVECLEEEDGVTVVATSSVYRSEPVGLTDQPEFLNAVVVVDSTLSPRGLLELARRIEDSNGRRRRQRWGPRTLDVDILLIDGVEVDEPDLTVPHPGLTERRFVLEPMLEVDPDVSLPDGTPLREVLDGIGGGQAVWMEGGL